MTRPPNTPPATTVDQLQPGDLVKLAEWCVGWSTVRVDSVDASTIFARPFQFDRRTGRVINSNAQLRLVPFDTYGN